MLIQQAEAAVSLHPGCRRGCGWKSFIYLFIYLASKLYLKPQLSPDQILYRYALQQWCAPTQHAALFPHPSSREEKEVCFQDQPAAILSMKWEQLQKKISFTCLRIVQDLIPKYLRSYSWEAHSAVAHGPMDWMCWYSTSLSLALEATQGVWLTVRQKSVGNFI